MEDKPDSSTQPPKVKASTSTGADIQYVPDSDEQNKLEQLMEEDDDGDNDKDDKPSILDWTMMMRMCLTSPHHQNPRRGKCLPPSLQQNDQNGIKTDDYYVF